MSEPSDWGVAGRICVGIARIHHRWQGEVDHSSGPLEIQWEGGETTLIDTRSDWTLRVTNSPWEDPLAGCSQDEVSDVEREIGRWLRFPVAPGDATASLIGRRALRADPLLNEVGELTGLQIDFEGVTLLTSVLDGEVSASVETQKSGP